MLKDLNIARRRVVTVMAGGYIVWHAIFDVSNLFIEAVYSKLAKVMSLAECAFQNKLTTFKRFILETNLFKFWVTSFLSFGGEPLLQKQHIQNS